MLEDGTIPREFEEEFENDFEADFDYELEDEDFFGEAEYAGEYEQEQFFGFLKKIIPKAVGLVRGIFGRRRRRRQREFEDEFDYEMEDEFDYEMEDEFDYEMEDEFDYEMEGELEYELDGESEFEQALADVLADAASKVSDNREAEALVAAATSKVLPAKSPTVRKYSRPVIKSATKLTRLFRKSRTGRKLIPMIPRIMGATGKTMAKQAARKKKVTSAKAGEMMVSNLKKTLTNPNVLRKNALRVKQNVKKAKGQVKPKKRRVPMALR